MLLQAFDFVHLREGARLPPAGRRLRSVRQHHGRLRAVAQDGRRRSCSASPRRCCSTRPARRWARPRRASASGSTPSARSPYAFYQYWFNVDRRGGAAPAQAVLAAPARRARRARSRAHDADRSQARSRSASSRARMTTLGPRRRRDDAASRKRAASCSAAASTASKSARSSCSTKVVPVVEIDADRARDRHRAHRPARAARWPTRRARPAGSCSRAALTSTTSGSRDGERKVTHGRPRRRRRCSWSAAAARTIASFARPVPPRKYV